jgi:biotin carboxylase
MKDSILIIGGGILQVPAVEIAKKKGLFVLLTDRDTNSPASKLADQSFAVDTSDSPGTVSLARELSKKFRIKAVFTEGADVEVTVAKVAEALGLISVSVEAAETCKNKRKNREILKRGGILQPLFLEVENAIDGLDFANKIGFPVVVKSVDNCASRGVCLVSSPKEFDSAYAEAVRYSSTGSVLIEECLIGTEHSLETLVLNGKHYHLNIVDRPFEYIPFPIEIGHINPTTLPFQTQNEMYEMTDNAARLVGINNGVAKADFIVTKRGPIILEMTARLSGGFDCQYTSPLARGVNYISAAMDISLGKEINPEDLLPKWKKVSACFAPIASSGIIEDISGVDDALKIPGIEHIFFRVKKGDYIPKYKNCADRSCFIISVGDSHVEAWDIAKKAASLIKISTISRIN